MTYLNEFSLKNKIIIVTGGNGLLGSEFCKSIAKYHGTPVILSRNMSKSNKLVKEKTYCIPQSAIIEVL